MEEEEGGVEVEGLKRYLQGKLPEYMVPVEYVKLKELPLTSNGKLDRRRLPEPKRKVEGEGEGEQASGRTAAEQIVGGIWEHVLGVEKVGVEENFFELGGHSLLATQVVSRVREALGVEVAVRTIFEYPTVAKSLLPVPPENE